MNYNFETVEFANNKKAHWNCNQIDWSFEWPMVWQSYHKTIKTNRISLVLFLFIFFSICFAGILHHVNWMNVQQQQQKLPQNLFHLKKRENSFEM